MRVHRVKRAFRFGNPKCSKKCSRPQNDTSNAPASRYSKRPQVNRARSRQRPGVVWTQQAEQSFGNSIWKNFQIVTEVWDGSKLLLDRILCHICIGKNACKFLHGDRIGGSAIGKRAKRHVNDCISQCTLEGATCEPFTTP
jgi:hypothetical protein